MAKGVKTGGRAKGVPNKATAAVKEIAAQYTEQAIAALVSVMQDADAPHAAKVSAANALLDRAHGKPTQTVDNKSTDGSMTPKRIEIVAVSGDGE
jgi:hypothetical protein